MSACGSSIDCAWTCPGCPGPTVAQALGLPELVPIAVRELDPMGSE